MSPTTVAPQVKRDALEAEPVRVERSMLGGRVGVHLLPATGGAAMAERKAGRALDRIEAWASRLTRFDDCSDLCRLNMAPGSSVRVRPTLAAVLDWGRCAEAASGGIVNVALLDERHAVELGHPVGSTSPFPSATAGRRWSLTRTPRATIVHRPEGLRFDLDGVAKGWLADRALELLGGQRLAVVDADGDVALALEPGASFAIGIEDPERDGDNLLVLRLDADRDDRPTRFGVATSGISKHAWRHGNTTTHHLIDPRTGTSASTDLVQATVIARTARHAEALAKSAVILGARDAEAALDRADVLGAVLLTTDRRLLLTTSTARFVA